MMGAANSLSAEADAAPAERGRVVSGPAVGALIQVRDRGACITPPVTRGDPGACHRSKKPGP